MSRRDWSASNYLRRTSVPTSTLPITMACWARTSIVGGAEQALMGMFLAAGTTTKNQLVLGVLATNDNVMAGSGDGTSRSVAATTTAISANTWFHAAGVFTSITDRAALLNGGGKQTNPTSRAAGTLDRTSIGVRDNASGIAVPFAPAGTGDIAEAAIWNIALSDADIAALAMGMSPLLMHPEALVAYFPIWGGFSPEIDLVNATGLTMTGTLTASDHPRVFMPSSGFRF